MGTGEPQPNREAVKVPLLIRDWGLGKENLASAPAARLFGYFLAKAQRTPKTQREEGKSETIFLSYLLPFLFSFAPCPPCPPLFLRGKYSSSFFIFLSFCAIKMQICALIHTREERKGKGKKGRRIPVVPAKNLFTLEKSNAREREGKELAYGKREKGNRAF